MHEQEDDALDARIEVRRAYRQRVSRVEFDIRRHGTVLLEQAAERQHAESARCVAEHPPASGRLDRVHMVDRLPVVHRC